MTIHECKEYGAGPCLNETLIGEIAEANATLADRITALEAQVAALTAERDEAQILVGSLTIQRDAMRKTVNQWIFEAADRRIALEAARQSRARLVAHVRRLRAKFSETMPDSAYVKRITDERDEAVALCAATMKSRDMAREELRTHMIASRNDTRHYRAELFGATAAVRRLVSELEAARQSRARLVGLVRRLRAKFSETMPDSAYVKRITDERDDARAWAAAWRSCAHWWFYVPRETDRYWFKDEFADQARQRRARRAAEAAEAQERR